MQNLNLGGYWGVGISLQSLIGANHINCDAQEWLFEEVTNMQKYETLRKEKKIIIYKYARPKQMHHNGWGN